MMDFVDSMNGRSSVDSIERMDGYCPHGKDVQPSRPIRSQKFTLSLSISLRFTQDKLVEGLYPLSYGCAVGRLYLFGNKKSRNATGIVLN